MVVENVLHMNAGDGENSYANNSIFQKTAISKARPFLEDTIKEMFSTKFPDCLKAADLGCSSGPNTLLSISEIIDTIHGLCQQMNRKSPEFQFFLNDLPENDFNTVFKSLPAFYEEMEKAKGGGLGPFFISAMPGSFYQRLFPRESIHLIHSSYSLHWLSKVPDGLANNKGNIYMARTSPPSVFKAYMEQFERDFSLFLSLRCEEMVSGGRMFLTFPGRSTADPSTKDCCYLWELLTKSLLDLAAEGLVQKADIDSFNMPHYSPFKEEVRTIIEEEGSFNLDRLEVFETNWDSNDDVDNKEFVFDKHKSGQNVAKIIRAVTEPMMAGHFGETVIDNLFARFAKHVAHHLSLEKAKCANIVISLTKR